MNKILFLFAAFITLFSGTIKSQPLSPELRARFVADQEIYFEKLNLHENQKRSYEEITRRYDKAVIEIERNTLNSTKRRAKIKTLDKSKNKEMKHLLSSNQYKVYLGRQKEILTLYKE